MYRSNQFLLEGSTVMRQVHPHLAFMVSAAAFATGVAVFLFTGLPFGFVIEGRLAYVSEGFRDYCGWAGAVLGSTGGVTMLGQLVVAVHINSTLAAMATLLQFLTWNIVLGVADTGWEVHYCALSIFFIVTVVFHRLASTASPYKSIAYQQFNNITILLLPFFAALFCAAAWIPAHRANLITATVTLEYTLALLTVSQQLCLADGLARCCSITLIFDEF